MHVPQRLRLAGLGLVLVVAGCAVVPGSTPTPTPSAELTAVELAVPADGLTVVAETDASAASVAASQALYGGSPAVVLASDEDEFLPRAASAAVALGVPLLVVDEDPEPVQDELERLGARHAVVAGSVEGIDGMETVTLPATADAASEVLGVDVSACDAEATLAGVAALDPGSPCLIEGDATATPPPAGDRLPPIKRADAADDAVALIAEEPSQLAAAATARAAGLRAVVLPADDPNPQRSSAAIEELSTGATSVVAIGSGYRDDARLDWKVRSARSGWQLPGGGQLLFPNHMMVAIYGTPGAPVLGILGEQDLSASIERARNHADPYRALTGRTVVPAFEIITSVASAGAGPDGNYSNEIDIATIKPWVEEAGRQGLYVVLDLQPGRTDFVTQARQYEELLAYPWVGLALDPEWRIGPDQVHLVQIGHVTADEVNSVVGYLGELTDRLSLPPKLLVLHQFRLDMIPDRDRVDLSNPAVTVLVHADGQGSQPAKQDTWRFLRQNTLVPWWGWKNFYDEDAPMLSPEQTMSQVVPQPDLVTYQ